MVSNCDFLSYLSLEFVEFLREQQCEAAERNEALGGERPGLDSLLGHLLTMGPKASYLTPLFLTSSSAC